MPAFHQKENRAQHFWILAQMKNGWSFAKMRMHHLEDSKFTCHVVGFGRDGTNRGAPEYVLAAVSIHPQQIRQVRVSARKLFDGDAAFCPFDFSEQPIGEGS